MTSINGNIQSSGGKNGYFTQLLVDVSHAGRSVMLPYMENKPQIVHKYVYKN